MIKLVYVYLCEGGGSMYENDDSYAIKEAAANKFATASFVFGIISLFSALCCCPFVFSALGILFALISKGTEKVLRQTAKSGLIFSCIGLVTSIVLMTFTFVLPFALIKGNPEYKKVFIESYEDAMKENEPVFRQIYGDEEYDRMEQQMMDIINNL